MSKVKRKIKRLFSVAIAAVMITTSMPHSYEYAYASEQEVQTEEANQEESKQEEPKQEEPKQEESKQEESKAPESSSVAPSVEESQTPESSETIPSVEESQTPESSETIPSVEESQTSESSEITPSTEESQAPESSEAASSTEESQDPESSETTSSTEESQTPESSETTPSTEETQTPESSETTPSTEETEPSESSSELESTEESSTEESSVEESSTEESSVQESSTEEETEKETKEEETEEETEEEVSQTVIEEETETEEESVECEIEYKAVAQKYNPNNISVVLMADVKNYTGDTDDIELCWKYVSGDVFPDTSAIKVLSSDIIGLKVLDKERDIKNFTLRCEVTGLLAATKYTFKLGTKIDGIEEYQKDNFIVTTAYAPFSHNDINFNAKQSDASDIQIDYNISISNTQSSVVATLYYKLAGEKSYILHETHEIGAGSNTKNSIYELAAGKTYTLLVLAGGMKKEISVTMSNVSVAIILPSEFDEESNSYNIVIDEFWYKIGDAKKFTKYPLNKLLSYQNTILLQVPNGQNLSFKVSFEGDYSMNYVTVAGIQEHLKEKDGVYTYKVNRERIYVEMFTRQKYNVSFFGEHIKVIDVSDNSDITNKVTTKGESSFIFKIQSEKGYTIKNVVSDMKDFVITKDIQDDGWYCTMTAKSLLANNVNVSINTQRTRKYQLTFDYPSDNMKLEVTVNGKKAELKGGKIRVSDNQVIRFNLRNNEADKGIFVSYVNKSNEQALFYNERKQDETSTEVVYNYYLGCLHDGSTTIKAVTTDMCDISFVSDSDNKYLLQLYKPYKAMLYKDDIIRIPKGYELNFAISDNYEYGSVYPSTNKDKRGVLKSEYSQEKEQYIYSYVTEGNKKLHLIYDPAKLRFSYDEDEIQDMVILNGGTELKLDKNNDLSYPKSYNITVKVKPEKKRTVRVGYYIYEEEDYKTFAKIEHDKIDSDGYYYYTIGTTDTHCLTIECPTVATIDFGNELEKLGIEVLESYDGEEEYYEFTKVKDSSYTCYQGRIVTFAVSRELDKGMAIVATANNAFEIIPGNYNETYQKVIYRVRVSNDMTIEPEMIEVVG